MTPEELEALRKEVAKHSHIPDEEVNKDIADTLAEIIEMENLRRRLRKHIEERRDFIVKLGTILEKRGKLASIEKKGAAK